MHEARLLRAVQDLRGERAYFGTATRTHQRVERRPRGQLRRDSRRMKIEYMVTDASHDTWRSTRMRDNTERQVLDREIAARGYRYPCARVHVRCWRGASGRARWLRTTL